MFGKGSGMAPRARIAMYKALWSLEDASQASGFTSDLVAAIDQAVADGNLTEDQASLMKARNALASSQKFLVVGQRWDLDLQQELDFTPGWEASLLEDVKSRGRLHPPGGSDYFIFPRTCFIKIPRFAIGRAGWDNWMFYHARLQRWPVVDASASITAIHQDHDYSHLPGGQPHYQLPESHENIRLAGGRRTIFSMQDANYTLAAGKLQPIPLRGRRIWRHFETYPLVRWKSFPLAEITFAICHPIKAFGEWRGRLIYLLRKLRHQHA